MPRPYEVVQNDYGDPITGTLVDGRGQPVSFPPDYELTFAMASAVRASLYVPFREAARWIDSAVGRWAYDFVDPQLALPGPFKAEVQVLTPAGPITFPRSGAFDVLVRAEVVPG